MTEKVKAELDRIVSVLVETGIVSKIILFGSHAKGGGMPDSDIDLCVLTPIEDKDPLDITIDLRVKLVDVQETSLDLLAYNQDDFSARAERPGSLHHHIKKHGVVLYE